jgi:hypothetical protein
MLLISGAAGHAGSGSSKIAWEERIEAVADGTEPLDRCPLLFRSWKRNMQIRNQAAPSSSDTMRRLFGAPD